MSTCFISPNAQYYLLFVEIMLLHRICNPRLLLLNYHTLHEIEKYFIRDEDVKHLYLSIQHFTYNINQVIFGYGEEGGTTN